MKGVLDELELEKQQRLYIEGNISHNTFSIVILHEGAEQRSILHEAGQRKGEFNRFDQAECDILLHSAPECCIPLLHAAFYAMWFGFGSVQYDGAINQ